MSSQVDCTSGVDTIPLSRWDSPKDGSDSGITFSRFFDPKVDKIDLQGNNIEDLVVVQALNGGIFIHYIPRAWQVKLAEKYTGHADFITKERRGFGSRNYNDIAFWGSRPYFEGPERLHTFASPKGTIKDFVFLLSNSKAEQFKTWGNEGIIFLGIRQKESTSDQDSYEYAPPIELPAKFKIKNIDKITNFNPSTDTLEIDTDSFGIDRSATFAAARTKEAEEAYEKIMTSSMTRRRAASISMKMAQIKDSRWWHHRHPQCSPNQHQITLSFINYQFNSPKTSKRQRNPSDLL